MWRRYLEMTALLFAVGCLLLFVRDVYSEDTALGAATATPTSGCEPEWSVVSSPNVPGANYLNGVAVVSANDVWAVGDYINGSFINQTLMEHWNGTAWSVVPSPNRTRYNYLNGVSVVSANDVWAVGYYSGPSVDQTLVEHWNGTSWSVVPSPNVPWGDNELWGVSVVSANDVWAVGNYDNGSAFQTLIEHWDGIAWSVVPSPNVGTGHNRLNGVTAVSANDVWAVGTNGYTLIEHWDGIAWSVVPSPSPNSLNILNGVTAVSANDVWAVGYCVLGGPSYQTLMEHWNGTSWSVVPSPSPGTRYNYLNGVAAVSSNDVWAVGYYVNGSFPDYETLVEHWNGTSWSVIPSPDPGTGYNYLNGIAAVSANDVWAVGYYNNSSNTAQTLVELYTSPCATSTSIINGHLTWQGISQPDITNTYVTGTLALCNATTPVTYTFTTDSSGNFTITTNLPDGTYHWLTKGGRHVSSSSPTDGARLFISGGHATQEFGTQRGGDTNSDNLANAIDFNTLKTQFALSAGQYSADFDYTGIVTALDFNMLKRDFNTPQHNLLCP